MNKTEILVSVTKASEMLGVGKQTLRRYPKSVLKPLYTPKGHRRYRLSDIEQLQGKIIRSNEQKVAVYVRVSSQDQKKHGDLDRQKARVLEYCIKNNYTVSNILDEVGSGLNDNRKKLHVLLDLVGRKEISKVVVEHKDRLTRFNFEILKVLLKSHGVEIEVIDIELNKTFEEELVSDIISLMSSFSARLYGKRSSRNKNNENK